MDPPSSPQHESGSDLLSDNISSSPNTRSDSRRSHLVPTELNSTIGSSPMSQRMENSPASSVNISDPGSSTFGLPSSPDISQLRGSSARQGPPADEGAPTEELRRAAMIGLEGIPKVADVLGEKVQEQFEQFLSTFVLPTYDEHSQRTNTDEDKYYINLIRGLKKYGLATIYVDWSHLEQLSLIEGEEGSALTTAIKNQYFRFLPYLQRGLRNVIRRVEPSLTQPPSNSAVQHAQSQSQNQTQTQSSQSDISLPTISSDSNSNSSNAERLFQVAFYNMPYLSRLRDLRADAIGTLMSFTGTVTRTSEVRPELFKGTFRCDSCLTEVPDVEQAFKYTTPYMCPQPTCNNRQAWTLIPSRSQFMDWQRVRVQENPGDIPTGSMPRTIDVILRGDVVERAKAGDKCKFTGTEIVIPDITQLGLPGVKPMALRDRRSQGRAEGMDGGVGGLKSLGARDLTYKLAFVACMAEPDQEDVSAILQELENNTIRDQEDNQDPNEELEAYLETLDQEEVEDLRQMIAEDPFKKLVQSVAPAVWGHESVKKGILLQLLGGVHKVTPEGIQIRGDINVCIVGDPSTSKSQFLKYVTGLVPRSVYTSGKASSAAGLTAAVVKDEENQEHTIEAGALMLADNGICAIDEFDKMDLGDQVAIHEAMEQQTISIAKAGIQATLNARTSILAAANPVGGRYNPKLSLRANVNMSSPIMSRFDLFFVVLDQCNADVDRRLANHIVSLHMNGDEAMDPPFSSKQLLRYISYAKLFKPKFTPTAKELLVTRYIQLRRDDVQFSTSNPTQRSHGGVTTAVGRTSSRITARQLESMIRLSEAIAKAYCVNIISDTFVQEAYQLLRSSVISVDTADVDIDDVGPIGSHVIDRSTQRDSMNRSIYQAESGANAEPIKTRISQEKFSQMRKDLLDRIYSESGQDPFGDFQGVDATALVNWYLGENIISINSEAELEAEKSLVQKVLKKLVREHLLLELRGDADDEMTDDSRSNVKYVIHPNASQL